MVEKKAKKPWGYGSREAAQKVCREKGHLLNKGGFCRRCRTIKQRFANPSRRFWP